MVSDFLVAHPSGPFFSLSQEEFDLAAKQYPSVKSDKNDLNFVNCSATAGINVGQDGYFDNDTILYQFERLFQLLSYKKDFKDHEIEIIVDNARTHSAKEYSINVFGKGIGTRCPVSAIEYVDDQNQDVSISCSFANGEHRAKSKGLLMLAKDLGVSVDPSVKLAELRTILTSHAAFPKVSRLENLARKYNIKVIFAPKFHCELNAIEGLWCYMKQHVRKNSDQTYSTMMRLIPKSREMFAETGIQMKLFRRFWQCLDAYKKGKTYSEVLTLFFSGSCKPDVVSHRRISNMQID